jgi:hypothetical protein
MAELSGLHSDVMGVTPLPGSSGSNHKPCSAHPVIPRVRQILSSLGLVLLLQAGCLGMIWLRHTALTAQPSDWRTPFQSHGL